MITPLFNVGFQFSGSYKGDGADSESLELRIDWEAISEHAKELKVLSGDIFAAGKWQLSFFVMKAVIFSMDSNSAKISGTGKIWDAKTNVSIEVTITKSDEDARSAAVKLKVGNKESSFTCARYTKFFRTVDIEVDFTSENLYLPTYDTHMHPSHPPSIPKRDINLFTAYADAGVDLRLDTGECSLVCDPDPNTAWSNSELYDIQEKELEGEDPSKWKIWCIMTEKYEHSSSVVGAMFDTKTRQGFGLFTKAGPLAKLPATSPKTTDVEISIQEKIALRYYLFTAVHECGHAFNLQHCFSMGRPNSLTWMNYATSYNNLNGSDSFYRNFEFCFDDAELLWLRHGPYNKVKPGEGNWGKISPSAIPASADLDDPDSWGRLLSFDIRTAKKKYTQMEPVTLEIRLQNLSTHSIFVETGFSPRYDIVKIYVTRPSGEIEEVNDFKSEDLIEPTKELHPQGSTDGPDRHSELVLLLYEADGFLFKDPGTYKIMALYNSGSKALTSNTVTLDIAPYQGGKKAQATLQRFFQDDVGRYISIGGSRSPRYDEVRNFLESLAVSSNDGYWAGALVAETFTAYAKDYKLVKSSRQYGKIDVGKLGQPDYMKLIRSTDATLKFCRSKGKKNDNLLYTHIVLQRAKILLVAGEKDKARAEIEECINNIQRRGVKTFIAEKVREIWKELAGEAAPKMYDAKAETNKLFYYEDKNFNPDDTGYRDRDREYSLTLGEVFSQFNEKHLAASTMIVHDLFDMADETEDLKSVTDYVYRLQHGREHNQEMIKYAFALFVIHHPLARKEGLRYPENITPAQPTPYLKSRPTGRPDESWMNYFRNDADFVYHHDHWHKVYVGQSLPSSTGTHLDRQGELFGYMHQQMLARYDAEREANGLAPVRPYDFHETEREGCDLRPTFTHPYFNPRPAGMRWGSNNIRQFQQWDYQVKKIIQTGDVIGPNMERINLHGSNDPSFGPNYFGHIVEATTGAFQRYYGSIHNMGHGVFGSIGQQQRRSSYMNSTATAVRDPIFFRWHKRVDTYIEQFNNTLTTELARDAPPVKITATDVIISQSTTPPNNFGAWASSKWSVDNFKSDDIQTQMGEPKMAGEFGKVTHKPYTYHIRVARSDPSETRDPLKLTIRIFICPARCAQDIRRWIEMDKFLYILPANQVCGIVSREDKHSSVIRRNPEDMQGDIEKDTTSTVSGFCECGWPYSMLFPCGQEGYGEPYKLCVFISDNNVDQRGVRTHCGSLSYCGARDRKYPDKRQMGYPFATPMLVNGRRVSVHEAASQLYNMAMGDFKIVKTDTRFGPPAPTPAPTPTPTPAPKTPTTPTSPPAPSEYKRETWYAQSQLKVSRFVAYRPSTWVGVFRVLINGSNVRASGKSVVIRFEGRGNGNGVYAIKNVSIGKRYPRSMTTIGQPTPVQFPGGKQSVIPEEGVQSLPVQFEIEDNEDYFVTFQVSQPACFLRNPWQNAQTWFSSSGGDKLAKSADWGGNQVAVSRNIYGVSKIFVPDN